MSIPKNCPLDRVFRLLAGEWTPHVIWVLGTQGETRFNDLQREVEGISPKVLTDRVRMLENEGVVERKEEPTVPPRVSYKLTAKGQALHQAIVMMEKAANEWFATGT